MRCCVVTRKYDDSAIVSHDTMKAYASSASSTKPMLARNTWYCRHSRPGGEPSPARKYPAPNSEIPAEAAPSRNRNTLLSASRRRWNGRSGSPSGNTFCSAGVAMLKSATAASATPTTAPNGNNRRRTSATLDGRARPSTPIHAQAASNETRATSAEDDPIATTRPMEEELRVVLQDATQM